MKMKLLSVTICFLTVVTGCSSSESEVASTSTSDNTSDSSNQSVTIMIGHQSPTAQTWGALIMKDQQFYEKHLKDVEPDVDFKIEWFDSPAGPPLNNSMVGGDMRLAFMGDMPILSNGIVGVTNPNYNSVFLAFDGKGEFGKNQSIIVPNEGVNSINDLEGLSVSTPFGSSAHRMLLAALEQNGLSGKVEVVDHSVSVGLQSIEEKKIDGHATWEPWPSFMEYRGQGAILFDGELTKIDYLDGVVANKDWVEENPSYAIAFLKALIESHQFILANPQEAAEIFAKESEFPLEVTEIMVETIHFDSGIYAHDIETLNGSLQFLSDQGMLEGELDLTQFIDDKYLKQAAEEMELTYLREQEMNGGKWIDWMSR